MSAQVPLAHTGQLHMTSFTPATHSNSHSELWSKAGFARHGQEGCGDAGERPGLGERPWGKRRGARSGRRRRASYDCLLGLCVHPGKGVGSPGCSAIVPPKIAAPSTSLNLRTAPRGTITAEEARTWSRPARSQVPGAHRWTPFSLDPRFWPSRLLVTDLTQLCTSLVEDSRQPGSHEGKAREPTLTCIMKDPDSLSPAHQ